jgi:hypothetical protein
VVIATVSYPTDKTTAAPESTWPHDHPINKTYTPQQPPAQNITIVPMKPVLPPPSPPPRQSKIFPPEEYDHYYEGDLTIRIVPTIEALRDVCGSFYPRMLACAIRYPKNCVIYMVEDEVMRKEGWTTGLLLRHEIGHCNGWPGHHPDQRTITWPSPQYIPAAERGRP